MPKWVGATAGRPPRRAWASRIRSVIARVVFAGALLCFLAFLDLPCLFSDLRARYLDVLDGPRVNLTYTTYVGTKLHIHNINVFRGMRYAAPPVGDLRWKAPVEPKHDDRVRSAKNFKPICLATWAPYPNGGQDEDCLFVNVWAPADATPASKLPVWVFIQGGGYTANANGNWDGEEVVKRSGNRIVYVNFNYRVGLWGFLASEKVRADGDLNAGMLDQRFLLQWVQKHISKFGGDPSHVVISGASAGAGSVALHLTAHGGRDDGLFSGALVMSLFFPAQPRVDELEWQFALLASDVGCGDVDGPDQMSCIRSRDTQLLQQANSARPFPGREYTWGPLFYWTPCVDGDLIMDLPYTLFEEGRFIDVPLIFGTDTDEGTLFGANAATQDEMRIFLESNYPLLSDADVDGIMQLYPLMDPLPYHQPWFPSTSKAYGEATFVCPTVNVLDAIARATKAKSRAATRSSTTADQQQRRGQVQRHRSSSSSSNTKNNASTPTAAGLWAYRYNVQDLDNFREGIGVPHTFELAAVFGPRSIAGCRRSYWTYNAPMVPLVMDYVLSFVRTLSPNTLRNEEAPLWEPWAAAKPKTNKTKTTTAGDDDGTGDGNVSRRLRLVLEMGSSHMEDTPADEVSRCQFWESLKEVMEQSKKEGVVVMAKAREEEAGREEEEKVMEEEGVGERTAQKRLLTT